MSLEKKPGRPFDQPGVRRVPLTCRVPDWLRERIDAQPELNTKIIEKALTEYLARRA